MTLLRAFSGGRIPFDKVTGQQPLLKTTQSMATAARSCPKIGSNDYSRF
jgi:hypothetical protein